MNYDIFEIENDPSILRFRNEYGDPIWMFMRYEVLYSIMSKYMFKTTIVHKSRPVGVNISTYMIKALLNNAHFQFRKKSAKVTFYATSRGVIKKGIYLNQYVDHLASLLQDDAVTIEHPPLDWKWYPKRLNNNVIYNAPNLVLSSAFIKVSHKDTEEIKKLISYVSRRVFDLFGFTLDKSDCDYIFKTTSYEMSRMVTHAKWILKQIRAYDSQLAIIVGGSYSRYIPIIRLLKSHGIKTADLQHGYITSTNPVYNYALALLGEDYINKAIPDYLLTYGEWWNNQSNLPYEKKIVIGNPFRKEMVNKFNRNKKRDKIVIIGCARNTLQYMELAEKLNSISNELEVVFRPHPTERYDTIQISNSSQAKFIVDYQTDLYQLLEETQVVISEISTVLFEAVGIVPRIIVWRTEFSKSILPECPFENFSVFSELIEIINSNMVEMPIENRFWNSNWESNFKQFINDTF